jgi:hypothetical protein
MSTMNGNGRIKRFRKGDVCPVCGGAEDDERGEARRCFGFLGSDGRYAHCSREEHATGELVYEASSRTWAHRIGGPCDCGREHAPATNGNGGRKRSTLGDPVAIYQYHDLAGVLRYECLRFATLGGKTFRQRRPDPSAKGGWAWNLSDVERLPYRLPELAAADPGAMVFVAEGEKDVDTLRWHGLVATCNSEGAGGRVSRLTSRAGGW